MTILDNPSLVRKNLTKIVALLILALMAIPSIPVHAQPAYLPGVVAGDSVTYGEVSGNQFPFNDSSSLVLTVTSVVGVNVGISLTFKLLNGTSRNFETGTVNVQTEQGNTSNIVIAGNLKAGDSLTQTPLSGSSLFSFVTETVSREYAGAIRNVNVAAINETQILGVVHAYIAFDWDQSTGLLMEVTENVQIPGPNGQNTVLHVKATSTNVWKSSSASDFSFDAVPNSPPFVFLGTTATYALNLTSFGGFSGTVSLTAQLTNSSAHPPALALGAKSVNVPTGGSATTTLTFSTDTSTTMAAYLFSVHATSGSLSRDALFAVQLQPPSFQVIATPANLTMPIGSKANSTITVEALGAFSGPVALTTYLGNPSITATFSKTIVLLSSTVSKVNSTLTVAVGSYAIPGDYSFYVVGNNGQNGQSAFIAVNVEGPHFELSLNSTNLTLSPGMSAVIGVQLTSISGFRGTVGLIDSSYGPAAIALNQSVLTLTAGGTAKASLTIKVAPGASPGTFISTSVTAISGLLEQSQNVFVNVPGTSAQFFISANPSSLTIQPGGNGNFTITLISNNGFSGHVALAAALNGSPLGYAFSSTNVTLTASGTATSILRVTVPATQKQGSTYINVYAVSGNQSQQTFLYVNIGTPVLGSSDFATYASPSQLGLLPGTSGSSTINVFSVNGFTGTVNLSALLQPGTNSSCPGASCPTVSLAKSVLTLAAGGSNSTTLSVNASSTTPHPSVYNILVTATNGSLTHFTSVSLVVCPCPRFDATFNVNSVTVIQGTTVSPTLIITSIDGFSGMVSLRESLFFGNCPGRTCPTVSLAPTTVFLPANGTAISTLTIETNSSTAPDFYNVQIYANSTGQVVNTYLNFNVVTLSNPDFTISLAPTALILSPGSAAPMSVLLTSLNGFSGKVALSGLSQQGVTVSPATQNVTLASGGIASAGVTVSVDAKAPFRGQVYVELRGTSGSLSHSGYPTVIVAGPDLGAQTGQSSLNLQAGGKSNSTLLTIVSFDGLQGSVSLQSTVNPCFGGVCPIVSMNPLSPSLTSGGWTMSNITVSAPLGTNPGYYTIAVNVTSQSITHFVYLSVYVNGSSIATPDFSIFASPSSTSIAQGGSVNLSITLKSVNSLKGTLTLFSTSPPGISSSLRSTSLLLTPNGSNSTTLTVSVPSTTSTGFYTVQVTATDGSLSHSAYIGVEVVGPDFSVAAKPDFVKAIEGKSAISTIVLGSIAGFTGTVNLSVSGGLPASFAASQVALSSGETLSDNLTISAFTNYPGYYYLTVTAFSGTVVHYAFITIQVTGPDFNMTANPSTLTIAEGSSAHSTILLTGFGGFSGPILLSSTSYFGIQTKLTPSDVNLNSTITSASVDLNVTVPATVVPGIYYYEYVSATNGILSHSVYIPIVVTGPDFTINPSTTFQNVRQGNNVTFTFNLSSLDDFQGTVNMSANSGGSLTTSLNSTVTLSSGGTGKATLVVSTTDLTTLGGHTVLVTGTSGILSHSVYVYVNVTGPDFSLSATQQFFTLKVGQTANSTITVRSVDGFTGTVKLTNTASGVTATFSASDVTINPTTSVNSTLTISIPATLSDGFYSFTVTGTSGNLSHTIYYFDINVVGPEFEISANPFPPAVRPGQTFSEIVSISSLYGFSGNVTLSVNGGSLTASLNTTRVKLVPGSTAFANLTITVPANIAPNQYYDVTVQVTNGTMVRTATVHVYPFVIIPDFNIGYVPSFPTIVAGSTGNFSVILSSVNGFSGTLNMTSTSPNGFATVLNPTKVALASGGTTSTNLAVSIPLTTLSGVYYVTVTATNSSGTPVHSAFIQFYVQAQNFTISALPTTLTIQAGSTGKSIINVLGLNGFSGTVNLTASVNTQEITATLGHTSLHLSGGVANSTELTISTTTATGAGPFQVTVNGTIGSLTRTVRVAVYVINTVQPTSTSVSCGSPITVDLATNCQVTVTSIGTSGATSPGGNVEFSTNSTGTFSPSSCTLTLFISSEAQCTVSYTPTVTGHALITATYLGDSIHETSTGNFTLRVPSAISVQIFGPANGVPGSQNTFTVSTSGGTPPYNFNWSAAGGTPATGTGTTFNVAYNVPGTYLVNVTVTDSSGVRVSTTASIAISSPILAASISGPTTGIAGKAVTFTTSASGGTAPYTFSWSAQGGNPTTGTGTSFQVTYATPGVYTINVTVTDSVGTQKFTTSSITISPAAPAVTITGPLFGDAGMDVKFTAIVSGGTSPFTFSWSTSGGTPATGTGSSLTVSYSVKGTYMVNVTVTDANGKTASAVQSITINPKALSTDFTWSPQAIIPGSPTTFTATPTGGTAPYRFSWKFGDGSTGTGNPVMHTFSTAGPFDVVVNVTDTNGAMVQVLHTLGGPLTVGVTCPTRTVSVGTTVDCTASATGGAPPYTFSWAATGGSPSSGTGAAISTTYNAKGSYTIRVNGTDTTGKTITVVVDVIVTPQPLTVSISGPANGMAGLGLQFTATASGGTGPYSFVWTAAGGGPSTGTGSTFTTTYNAKGTYSIKVNASDANGNTAAMSATVTITPLELKVGVSSVTVLTKATLTATASGGTAPYSFAWIAFGGTPSSGSGSTFTTTYSTQGTFKVNVTVTDGNGKTVTVTTTIQTTVPPISTDFTISPTHPTTTTLVTLNATATGGTGSFTYAWNFGDATTGTGNPITHTFFAAGTYNVTLTVKDSIGDTTTAKHSVVVTAAGKPILLTFSGFDLDDFDNSMGQLQVFVNGHMIVDIPAGLNHLKGTGDYLPYANRWVNFGPFDITAFVVNGQNNITFTDHDPADHFSRVRNVTIVQGTTQLLNVPRSFGVYPGFSKTYTFSNPPLTIKSITANPSGPTVGQPVTFIVDLNGGTSPFRCSFSFGDGATASVIASGNSCTITHTYDVSGTFSITVRVRGASTSDSLVAAITVKVN